MRRKFRVNGLSKGSAKSTTFDMNGTKISVLDYFAQKYQVRVNYPDLPCASVGNTGALIPLEFLDVEPCQRLMKKLDDRQTADMIKVACQKPEVRSRKLQEGQ
jgi:eukaryotic translation initiation factor 2C